MPRVTVWIVRTAFLHLGIGITLGSYMLAAKGASFDLLALRWLPLHIEMLLFGWMLQLAIGVALWITPRFMKEPRYGNMPLAWLAYGSLNLGIGMVLFGYWRTPQDFNLILLGRLMEFAALIFMFMLLWPRIKAYGT